MFKWAADRVPTSGSLIFQPALSLELQSTSVTTSWKGRIFCVVMKGTNILRRYNRVLFQPRSVMLRLTLRNLEFWYHRTSVGRDSSVGMTTRYGLDGPGIESRLGGEIFRTRPDRPWGPPSLLWNGYQVSPGGKTWRGADHPPPSSAEVKERVKLYLYSPSGPSCPVLGWTVPLTFTTEYLTL